MRMNFLSTTRDDMEFGLIDYTPEAENNVNNFDLVYKFQKKWDDSRIKVKNFLQAIDL